MLDVGTDATYNLHHVERLHGFVHGDVQGVGFRDNVQRRARELGLQGSVRNRRDGAVEVVAEGSREALDRLRQGLEEAPGWPPWSASKSPRNHAPGRSTDSGSPTEKPMFGAPRA